MIGTRFVAYAVLLTLSCIVPAFAQSAGGETKSKSRQDTGMSDPSVNPGQASGMRVVRGEVKQASPKTIVIEDSKGKATTMSVDAATAGDRDVRPGDIVTGTITGQGRAIAIHKEAKEASATER